MTTDPRTCIINKEAYILITCYTFSKTRPPSGLLAGKSDHVGERGWKIYAITNNFDKIQSWISNCFSQYTWLTESYTLSYHNKKRRICSSENGGMGIVPLEVCSVTQWGTQDQRFGGWRSAVLVLVVRCVLWYNLVVMTQRKFEVPLRLTD